MTKIKDFELVDLTHTIDEAVPTWTGECGFHRKLIMDYPEGACVFEYKCIASAGTHIDAPSHFIQNGRNIDQLTLEELCVPICIIDMSEERHANAQITLKDFEHFEKKYGEIPKKSVVIGNTGWSYYWENPELYRGSKTYPVAPTFSEEVGNLLIKRDITGIGIDTFSPDPYGGGYPLHKLLLGQDKFIIENLTNLDKLPKTGSFLIALPLKIKGGTESPIRAIALIPT